MEALYNKFLDWAQSKFDSVEVKGNEICVNSIFTEDKKKKLWCNPSGGKNQIRYGVFHCWKTEKKGTLLSLVMEVEKCSKPKAMEILGIQGPSRHLVEEINFDINFLDERSELDYEKEQKIISFPPNIYEINKAPTVYHQRATFYLTSRKIPTEDFLICTSGKYENRIIIPYYNSSKKLVYFNSRDLGDNPLRYKGPDKSIGVGKEDVIYFPKFPEVGDTVFLCEGEFDAYSLHLCGLKSAACGGKFLSEKQSIILSYYNLVLALDADEAGDQGKIGMYNKIIQYNKFSDVMTVRPPEVTKDWNELYKKFDDKIVLAYINQNIKKLEI